MRRKLELQKRGESLASHVIIERLEEEVESLFKGQPHFPCSEGHIRLAKPQRSSESAIERVTSSENETESLMVLSSTLLEEEAIAPLKRSQYSREKYLVLGMEEYQTVRKKYKSRPLGRLPQMRFRYTQDCIEPSLSR
jgi:hypothetical protein